MFLGSLGKKQTKKLILCIKMTINCSGTPRQPRHPLHLPGLWSLDDSPLSFIDAYLLLLLTAFQASSSSCSLSSEPSITISPPSSSSSSGLSSEEEIFPVYSVQPALSHTSILQLQHNRSELDASKPLGLSITTVDFKHSF